VLDASREADRARTVASVEDVAATLSLLDRTDVESCRSLDLRQGPGRIRSVTSKIGLFLSGARERAKKRPKLLAAPTLLAEEPRALFGIICTRE